MYFSNVTILSETEDPFMSQKYPPTANALWRRTSCTKSLDSHEDKVGREVPSCTVESIWSGLRIWKRIWVFSCVQSRAPLGPVAQEQGHTSVPSKTREVRSLEKQGGSVELEWEKYEWDQNSVFTLALHRKDEWVVRCGMCYSESFSKRTLCILAVQTFTDSHSPGTAQPGYSRALNRNRLSRASNRSRSFPSCKKNRSVYSLQERGR